MNILHIATGFPYSSLYKNLFLEMSRREVTLNVYIPQHDNGESEDTFTTSEYNIYANNVIKNYDKIFYFTKINRMRQDVINHFDMKSVDIIHAHSLFSDGAVAYELFKKYEMPYIVAIRNTDISKYYKFAKHLKPYARKILNNAKKIVFISDTYKKMFFEKIETKNNRELAKKSEVIFNGVDDFWHQDKLDAKKWSDNNKIKILFVGKLTKRKNVETVLLVHKKLKELNFSPKTEIVGEGPLSESLKKSVELDNSVLFTGEIREKEKLKAKFYSNDILLVPSFNETFGLVYAEALSCGTPVIYTKGQGFDGVFEDGQVGYPVEPTDVEQIVEAILRIKDNYNQMSQFAINNSIIFNWKDIVDNYIKIYSESSAP